MARKIFIDGEAGTTGLGIVRRLRARGWAGLIRLGEAHRKDPSARAAAMAEADVTVLCLPDEAAREAVALAPPAARLLDASSAHRVAPGWVYGLPELAPGWPREIAGARLVANPGCYATGAIALLRPLIAAGLLAADRNLTIHAVSGYSGGGKPMIAAHEAAGGPAFELYALGLAHKHIPEIMRYAGLAARPIFSPSVGHFAQGMLVCVPLFLDGRAAGDLIEAYRAHYAAPGDISVHPELYAGTLTPDALNDTDRLEIFVCANEAHGHAMAIARLDNLGKGASGAAVRNLALMLGEEE